MSLVIDHLCRFPEHTPLVAEWIHREFWAGKGKHSVESLETRLRQAVDPDQIPISLLALRNGVPIGTVNMVESDSERYASLRPWLAALFVDPHYRHHGVGTALVRRLLDEGRRLDVPELFLGTDIPGFYSRLGASVYARIDDVLCVMRFRLGDEPWKGW